MKELTVLGFIILLFSCGSSKETIVVKEIDITHIDTLITSDSTSEVDNQLDSADQYNISIYFTHFTPYCGGAAPDPGRIAQQTRAQSNTYFLLINLNTGEKSKVKTNDMGFLYLNLPQGKYAIREMYKDVSFEEFREQYYQPPSDYHQESPDEECYRKWWQSNLGEFTILAGDEVQELKMGTSESCFTGNNPCISYTGPYPP